MSKKSTELTCVLDRFENSKAVLRFDFSEQDQQELIVAKRFLPPDIKEGGVINLEFFSDEIATQRRHNLAKQVLDEILKVE